MLKTGSVVPVRQLTPVAGGAPEGGASEAGASEAGAYGGGSVSVPDPERLVHLQFRRFAGCPVCHLHLRSVVRRHAEIEAAGIREVVLFHSTAEELRPHIADFPFAVIADPQQRLYREFGVESSPRSCWTPAPGGRCCGRSPARPPRWRGAGSGFPPGASRMDGSGCPPTC